MLVNKPYFGVGGCTLKFPWYFTKIGDPKAGSGASQYLMKKGGYGDAFQKWNLRNGVHFCPKSFVFRAVIYFCLEMRDSLCQCVSLFNFLLPHEIQWNLEQKHTKSWWIDAESFWLVVSAGCVGWFFHHCHLDLQIFPILDDENISIPYWNHLGQSDFRAQQKSGEKQRFENRSRKKQPTLGNPGSGWFYLSD